MSLFNPNVPTGLVKLSFDYQNIQNNMQQLDTSFGVDHFPFSDATTNNGFHNKVTTPLIQGSVHPTTTTNPIFYAMQNTAGLGVLQFSRGTSNAVPTPVTVIHSTAAAITLANNATTTVLDTTGINILFATIYAFDTLTGSAVTYEGLFWTGAILRKTTITASSTLSIVYTAPNIGLKNISGGALNNIYWTLDIRRIQ